MLQIQDTRGVQVINDVDDLDQFLDDLTQSTTYIGMGGFVWPIPDGYVVVF